MGSKSIIEEEYRKYQRMFQGIKDLPGDDDIHGQRSFKTLLRPDLDPSWLRKENPWAVEMKKLSDMDWNPVLKAMPSNSLLKLEEKTCRLADTLSVDKGIPLISAQISAMSALSDEMEDKWKKLVLPHSLISDYERIARNQHKAIQKNDANIESRLGMLDAASKFMDRQVGWTGGFLTVVQDQIENDWEDEWEDDRGVIIEADTHETEDETATTSTLAKIPRYIAYTGRKDLHITAEEGLEKSILVEITEMGKRIMENAMAINTLCQDKNKDKFFKPTDKLIKGAVEIATITCTSKDELGKIIDDLYFLLYENLERMKAVVTDDAVRNERIYDCIFAVKSIRTDFRHDFEHGKEASIKKKRKEINDYYKRYCSKIPLKQKDFLLLQKNLFKDVLLLEEHLVNKLEELQDNPQQVQD